MGRRRVGRNKGASAISDRSGMRFPMSEMVREKGTNYLVHRSEDDGQYSVVAHPLSNLEYYLRGKHGDPFPTKNARPRPDTELVSHLTTFDGSGHFGVQFYLHEDSLITAPPPPPAGLVSVTGTLVGDVDQTFAGFGSITGVGTITGTPTSIREGTGTITVTGVMTDTGIVKDSDGSGIITATGTMTVSLSDFLSADWDDDDWFTGGIGDTGGTITVFGIMTGGASDWLAADWDDEDWA